MGKLAVFNFASLDGYYKGLYEDISWHRHGAEENAYAAEGLEAGGMLLFGRVTYEMMAGFWPTAEAMKRDPVVAEAMNKADKVVFSKSLKRAEWSHTRLVGGDLFEAVRNMKRAPGQAMTLLGSGSIAAQLAGQGLIDEYQIMVDPVVLGAGTPIFKGLERKLDLRLTGTRVFKSGVVLLSYAPQAGV